MGRGADDLYCSINEFAPSQSFAECLFSVGLFRVTSGLGEDKSRSRNRATFDANSSDVFTNDFSTDWQVDSGSPEPF